MDPASIPRGRARNASKTLNSRVNAVNDLHPSLQEIIKDCPALDNILGNGNRRGSTHNRARDKDRVLRPPNAYIVYRSYAWHTKQLEVNGEKNLSVVSQITSDSWRAMGQQAQYPFKQLADIAKREHAARNPDYKYAPSSRSKTSQKKSARRVSKAKAKVKVKGTATHRNAGFNSLPLLKEATSTPASTPVSSEPYCSSSYSLSPSPPSTPPTPMPRLLSLRLPPSPPKVRYPCDPNHTEYPPQPCVRPVTSGLIPSPSMSVLHLNDAHTPSILDELPDKYKEAESYHDLQPHALLHNEGIPFDSAPNAQIPVRPVETTDLSGYISGNLEANLGTSILDPSHIGWCFPGPSNTTINDDVNSSTLKWSVFDMPTLGFDGIVDENSMCGPHDNDLFDPVITYEEY